MRHLASLTSAMLALVFLFAGSGKLLDKGRTHRAIVNLGAPPSMASFLGALLAIAELATGTLLLIPTFRWYGAGAALVLLTIFLTALSKAYRDGVTADCGCFGRETKSGINATALLRNVILIGLVVFAMSSARSPFYGNAGKVLLPMLISAAAGLATLLLLRQETLASSTVATLDGPESPFQWPLEHPDLDNSSRVIAAK